MTYAVQEHVVLRNDMDFCPAQFSCAPHSQAL